MKQRNVVGCTVQYILVESCSFPIQIRSHGEAAFEIMFPNTRTLVDLCSKDEIKCDTMFKYHCNCRIFLFSLHWGLLYLPLLNTQV